MKAAVVIASLVGACGTEPPLDVVVVVERDGEARCGGAQLDERWVLTAKHCLQDPAEALADTTSRFAVRRAGTVIGVDRVELLGGVYQGLADLSGRDLALLRLDAPIPAPGPLALGEVRARERVFVTVEPRAPRAIPLTVTALEPSVIYTEGATCSGDSGSAVFGLDGALIAIASWRTAGACGTGRSAFTRLDAHRAWIDAVRAD